jgi:hypothetical protein
LLLLFLSHFCDRAPACTPSCPAQPRASAKRASATNRPAAARERTWPTVPSAAERPAWKAAAYVHSANCTDANKVRPLSWFSDLRADGGIVHCDIHQCRRRMRTGFAEGLPELYLHCFGVSLTNLHACACDTEADFSPQTMHRGSAVRGGCILRDSGGHSSVCGGARHQPVLRVWQLLYQRRVRLQVRSVCIYLQTGCSLCSIPTNLLLSLSLSSTLPGSFLMNLLARQTCANRAIATLTTVTGRRRRS